MALRTGGSSSDETSVRHVVGVPTQRPLGTTASSTIGIEPQPRQRGRRRGSLTRLIAGVFAIDGLVVLAAMSLAWPMRGIVPRCPARNRRRHRYCGPGWASDLVLVAGPVGCRRLLLAAHVRSRSRGVSSVGKASLLAAFATSTGCYFSNTPLSRGFLVASFVIGIPALLGERSMVGVGSTAVGLDGTLVHRVFAVGSTRFCHRSRPARCVVSATWGTRSWAAP